jgi:hypothetical protein
MMLETMYVLVVATGLSLMYFILSCCLALFFEWRWPQFTLKKSLRAIGIIFAVAVLVMVAMESVESRELANRIEHAVGGGFLAFLVCYLVARDMGQRITRFQFFVLAFLTVTALGVANEIIEFIAQEHFGIVLAKNLNDTWLDLISNTLGALFAAACFVPRIHTKLETRNNL